MGLNWYTTDPTLQATMAYYLPPGELAFAEPHLTRFGELMSGPVARWAEETDRNPPRLERYDRWGHDISRVVMPTSFAESRRAVLDAQQALRYDARRRWSKPVTDNFRVQLSAQPGRHRDGMRARNRWRHGEVVGRRVRTARRAGPRAGQVRVGGMGGRDRAAADGADRRVGPRRAGDDRDASRRCVAAQRLQVVRVELQRRGVRRAGQTRGRARLEPWRRDLPRAAHPARRLAATACGCAD